MSELRAFLGFVDNYCRFIEFDNLSIHSVPMYDPLKSSNFISSNVCRAAFLKIQQLVTSNQVLMYYDSQKPLTLLTDASPYWLRTVLYSRILSVAEKKYSQIELLAWSVCGEGGVKIFYTLLCEDVVFFFARLSGDISPQNQVHSKMCIINV